MRITLLLGGGWWLRWVVGHGGIVVVRVVNGILVTVKMVAVVVGSIVSL